MSDSTSHKNNHNGKKRKKGRLRYERVISVGVLFIVLIVMLVSCIDGCSGKNGGESSVIKYEQKRNTDSSSAETDKSTQPSSSSSETVQPSESGFNTVNLEYSEINKGDLVLVNKSYEYKFTEELDIVDVFSHKNDCYTVSDMEISLDSNVISYFNSFMEAYNTANNNKDIRIIEAYRSKDTQDEKFSGNQTDIAGGFSEYNTARTFDLGSFPESGSSYYLVNEGVYSWIYENASSYGFILRYPESKDLITGMTSSTYTFRYVGIPHAIYISQNNLTLEEYIENIKSYNNENPLKVTDGTKNYNIYYVPATPDSTTQVPVPSDQSYTISGNNIDGFIVTITLN